MLWPAPTYYSEYSNPMVPFAPVFGSLCFLLLCYGWPKAAEMDNVGHAWEQHKVVCGRIMFFVVKIGKPTFFVPSAHRVHHDFTPNATECNRIHCIYKGNNSSFLYSWTPAVFGCTLCVFGVKSWCTRCALGTKKFGPAKIRYNHYILWPVFMWYSVREENNGNFAPCWPLLTHSIYEGQRGGFKYNFRPHHMTFVWLFCVYL